MPFMSSPVACPPTSPQHEPESPRKRRKLDEVLREPLQDLAHNAQPHNGPFIIEEDSEDSGDDEQDLPQPKTSTAPKKASADNIEMEDAEASTAQNLEPRSPLVNKVRGNLRVPAVRYQKYISPVNTLCVRTCSGRTLNVNQKNKQAVATYEEIIARRSAVSAGRASKSYYGVDIHRLLEQGAKDNEALKTSREIVPPIEHVESQHVTNRSKLMWTEKYRARKFTDLVGDERTHRSVLTWLKAWDPIVFPGVARPKPKIRHASETAGPERAHRKVLLLTGPPGLGKTTLAHVCARQAGYEVQEINASDERSGNVVKGRIRDMVATENVRQVKVGPDNARKASRPVCVVVDEVDGVVSGNSGNGGEGGFIKALADLLALDARNSNAVTSHSHPGNTRKKKGDRFRMLRPLILICNDVYHPSLRILRQGTMAEIIYVRKPAINMVVPRMQQIFEKEGVAADSDGVRQLCEAAWGVSNRKEEKAAGGANDGDIRGILVIAEWVASRLRSASKTLGEEIRLSKRWIEQHVLSDLAHGGGGSRSIGRGGSKEIVERVFAHNAGFPVGRATAGKRKELEDLGTQVDAAKQQAMNRLRELIDSSGEDDRIVSGCFSTYPTLPFQDDNYLTKPCIGYEWLHFHDRMSSLVHQNQEWELAGYLSSPVLAFHHLFSSTSRHSYAGLNNNNKPQESTDTSSKPEMPFNGPRAAWEAHETQKVNHAALQQLQSQLSLPLHRAFRSTDELATELLPYILRMLAPEVKPVIVGGSEKGVASVRRGPEKEMVTRAVDAMIACGVSFEKSRVDIGESAHGATGGWVYRMEPGLDALGVFETAVRSEGARVRFAVRQVLEQEMKREIVKREQAAGLRRMKGLGSGELVSIIAAEEEARTARKEVEDAKDIARLAKAAVKRDFFGRAVVKAEEDEMNDGRTNGRAKNEGEEGKVWVTHREGYSNAVRKGLTLKELLDGL